ncbi:MAG: 30S ribosomal protein S20 [Clostridiales bacterium]|uniref:Small ribosomal subunit protein bS20 n=1 Tax=Harryflintia acetispora TaxID=1849041 RepID=A0A9X8ULC7_9FIRM|nr:MULTISPECIES: 30S ribosomal protein S20 [Oscillospiraceae]PWM38291.1 MAG: 30S ribosomal protein S20 [Clostridiales bacterium]RGB68931.1 30S ribosomal protein S20 [Harryflintia acetispora]TCL45211.1 small subunit ribosomal protein S20 [Harryflintia acetispora]
MANVKSAKKRVKVIATKTMANKAVKSDLKTAIKKANAAVENNAADKQEVVRVAIKTIDQACAKGVLHANTASRRKSSLARKLNAVG